MTTLAELLPRVVADLVAIGARHALVGGHAVSIRTEPRFTRDLDVAVAVADDRDAEHAVHALAARGYRVAALVEHESAQRLATARLEHRSSPGFMVDLLFASSGIEGEIVSGATRTAVLATVEMQVATIGHLIATKVLSFDDRTRPQDRIDLRALLRAATPADIHAAEQALALVRQRGFDRGRDLPAALAKLRGELR